MTDAPIDRSLLHDADPVNCEIKIEIRNRDLYWGASKAQIRDHGIRVAL
ncbi:MAG: hypothetical protein ACK4TL_19985 [Hyphomicrobiaceae bacterium]